MSILCIAAVTLADTDKGPSLVGTWTLSAVDDQAPATISVGKAQVEFRENGTWSFDAMMVGKFKGMPIRQGGFWEFDGKVLKWKSAKHSGKAKVTFDGDNVMRFDVDPVLRPPSGKGTVRSEWHRVQ